MFTISFYIGSQGHCALHLASASGAADAVAALLHARAELERAVMPFHGLFL